MSKAPVSELQVAGSRYDVFGKSDVCRLSDAAAQGQFLEA